MSQYDTLTKPQAISHGGDVHNHAEDATTLAELLLDAVAKAEATHKQLTFRLEDGSDRVLSYADLLTEARCILTGLQQQGLQPQDNVIFLLEKNQNILPSFWACMLGGFRSLIMEVPEHFQAGNRAFEHVCSLAQLVQARLIITESPRLDEARQLNTNLNLENAAPGIAAVEQLRQHPASEQQHTSQADDIACFWLTSGSTGTPKCVAMRHRNILTRAAGANQFNDHNSQDVYLNWLPFDHNGSVAEHIRCVKAVCDMVYLHKEDILSDPLNMLHTIDRYRITHTWGPNFIYSLIRDALRDNPQQYSWDLSSIRFMISGGEPVAAQTMHDFLQRVGEYGYPRTGSRPSFGMAEAGGGGMTYSEPSIEHPLGFFWIANNAFNGEDVAHTAADTADAHPISSLGRPIPGVSIRVVDQQGQLQSEDTVGHIHLKGPLMLEEYYNNPEANQECFLDDGWFDTGDLGFLSQGELALTGRAKAMIIINGVNYYSHEIEGIAEEVPGVERAYTAACAVRQPDSPTEQLAIFFHQQDDDDTPLSELLRQIRQAVVQRIHLNPDYIISVARETIPKTPIGKIQRTLLSQRFNQGVFNSQVAELQSLNSRSTDSGEPRNDLERLLVDVWQEILEVPVSIHDNFFELGGNSIKAVMVMNTFQEKIGAIFHPVSLFDAPTIAGLADYFESNYPALFDAAAQQDAPRLNEAQIEHMQHYLRDSLSSPQVHSDTTTPKNKRAVFILSPARSGSTLLRVVLAGNPQLFSPPELYLLGFNHLKERAEFYADRLAFIREGVTRAIMELKGCDAAQAEQLMQELEAQDLSTKDLFARLQDWAGERMVVDKTPPYAFNPAILQRLEDEFADPLYIHLMRHPAGMIASFEEARVDLAVDVHGDENGEIALSGRDKGEAWWLVSHQNILNFLQDIPAERQHLVKFEDLVTDSENTIRTLCDFLGIDFHADMLEPQQGKKQRMTDGTHELSRLAGDPKFHTHKGFSSSSAERWQTVYPKDFLCEQSWQIARQYDYRFEQAVSLADFQVQADPAQRSEPFPLTDIQEAYWAGRMGSFELGGYSVHSYTEIDAENLDLRQLQRAWQKMLNRHEMLRAVILPSGQQQIITEVPRYNIRVTDLAILDEDGVASELAQTRERLSHQVFELDQWPLFEICVSRLDAQRCRVHLSFDAILFDARSRYIIFSEFRQFYQQPELELPDFELSFRDYVLAEERIRHSALYEQSRDYWLAQLPHLPPPPELPLAINPAQLEKPQFVQKNHFLPKTQWSQLKELAAQQQISPSCLLLTAFADVLRLWNKLDSFTINLTAYNRQNLHPEVADIIGDFTSVILLGIDAPEQNNFIARAHQIQKRLWDNINHNHFSGVQVLRELSRLNGHKPNAQMPIVFTSVLGDEINESAQQTTDWLGEIAFNVAQTPQIWFDHIAFEEGGGLLCRWNIIDGLFPAGVMDAMFSAYWASLYNLLQDPASWQRDWHSSAQQLLEHAPRQARQQANATSSALTAELMHTLFAQQVALQPDATAVIAAERSLSYAELFQHANQLGHRLQNLGAQPNQLVAVVMEKGWQQVVAVMGILASGAAYLPVDPSLPSERFQYLLEFGQVDTVVTDSTLQNLFSWPEHIQLVDIEDPSLAQESSQLPPIRQQETDLSYVIFTSGSTGLPKGVMIDHRGAVNTLLDINARFKVSPQDRAIALSALNFDLSVYDIFGLLAAGGAVVMPSSNDIRNPPRWVELVNQHQVTLWNTVPAFVGLLTDYLESHSSAQADSLRLLMMSGDWIPVSLPERIQQQFQQPQVISLGGATEASIWSILYPITTVDPQWSSIPYGKPMLNQQFHVLDKHLQDCPDWIAGDLYIGGIGLAQGYWRDEEKTANAFITHPQTGERLYKTGDLGRYLADGNIEFLGREDFQVKIQGFRVEIGEIEAALMQHPAIKVAVVDAKGAAHAEKQLVAYCQAEAEQSLQAAELQAFLRQKIPSYMIPAVFIALQELPLSANGKVDRKALPDPATVETLSVQSEAETPATTSANSTVDSALTQQLTQIVEGVLEQQGLHVEENIFHYGATSIHMMRIINQVELELGFRPAIDDFYTEPSIAGLLSASGALEQQATDSRPASPLMLGNALLEQFEFIADVEARNAFRQRQAGIRELDSQAIQLRTTEQFNALYDSRRSYRHFADSPISLADFSAFLASLQQRSQLDQGKYLYGSAGNLYPLQAYVYVKAGRVESLAEGIYYYHPLKHQLQLLSSVDLDERIYNPHVNRPIFQRAAFALFLISDLAAIAPLYKEHSLHFSVLEAGLMSQLLEMVAPENNLGLCQIGEVDFQRVREHFSLQDSHVLMHSLLGGIPLHTEHMDSYDLLAPEQTQEDETEREEEEF